MRIPSKGIAHKCRASSAAISREAVLNPARNINGGRDFCGCGESSHSRFYSVRVGWRTAGSCVAAGEVGLGSIHVSRRTTFRDAPARRFLASRRAGLALRQPAVSPTTISPRPGPSWSRAAQRCASFALLCGPSVALRVCMLITWLLFQCEEPQREAKMRLLSALRAVYLCDRGCCLAPRSCRRPLQVRSSTKTNHSGAASALVYRQGKCRIHTNRCMRHPIIGWSPHSL